MKENAAAVLGRIPLKRVAVPAPAAAPVAPPRGPSGEGPREHAARALLEEELRAVRAALVGVASYVASVEAALGDPAPPPQRLLGLAVETGPAEQVDALSTALWIVRRRLAQVARR